MDDLWGAVFGSGMIAHCSWYSSRQELLEALRPPEADRPENGSADSGRDGDRPERARNIFLELDEATNSYNRRFNQYSTILWWGPFMDLCESSATVPAGLRNLFHATRGNIDFEQEGGMAPEDHAAFMAFLETFLLNRASLGS
jgi:hypothetical protein